MLDYNKIFNRIPVSYIAIKANDPNYTVVASTDYHLDMLGVKREDLIGKSMFGPFPDVSGNQSKIKEYVQEAVDTKKTVRSQVLRYDIPSAVKDVYETKYWTLDFTPIMADNGEVEFVLQLATDITNLVNLGFQPK